MADFQQNFLNSFQTGLGIGQQVRGIQDRNRINQLASQGYSAPAEQRPELLGQIAAVDARAAQQQEQSFSNTDERRDRTLANMSRILTSAPDQVRPSLYRQMLPNLRKFGMTDAPEEYNAETAPIINQAAQSIASAYGGGSGAAGVQSTYVNDQNQRVALMRDGTTRILGNNDPGANYQNLERDINGTPTQLTFNKRTGEYSNATMGGQPQEQRRQPSVPGFGIAETDNYVRNILGKVQVDPNASPEQQAEQLLPALIQQESGGNPNAVSPKGAAGLTQVMPATGRDPGFGVSPLQNNSPEENVRFGREYLTAMLRRYPGRPDLALAAYNAGPGVADRFASPVASAGGALTGRRAEDEAAAVEAAKLGVQQQYLPQELEARTDSAIRQSAGIEQAKSQQERQSNERAKTAQLNNVDRGLSRIDSAMSALDGTFVDTGPIDGQIVRTTPAGQELEAAVGAIQNDVLALTRVPGIGSQSDLEAKIANLKYPSIYNAPEVNRRNAQQLKAFISDLRNQISASGGNSLQTTSQVVDGPAVRVNSASDYDALPSGATYIDPQGNQRRKR